MQGGFPGALFAVNPHYDDVCGVPCYPTLRELPQTAEHVVFAVSDERIEEALDMAIEHGVRAATIMSSLVLRDDCKPPLRVRIRDKVEGAGLVVCGGNGMGFYNFRDRVWACGFDTRRHRATGNVTLISHSGSGMCGIVDVEERIDFNLAVSTGQELSVSMDEYMDFALELPDTKVIGLFMETARKPAGLIRALEKANARNVPVVAIKVGRSALAAELTVSHSGAMAGTDSTFDAVFDRYGVMRVRDMDELATALIMFAQPHPVRPGGLVSIHDSGGERQLLIDLAEDTGVPLAELSQKTIKRLAARLDPGLPAVNPLDAWSAGGPNHSRVMEECLSAMLEDANAAVGAVIHDRAPGGRLYPEYIGYLEKAQAASGKPVFLVANRQGTGADPLVISTTHRGTPVLDGVSGFLVGVKCLFDYRDFRERPPITVAEPPAEAVAAWRERLSAPGSIPEHEAMALLQDFGLPANAGRIADSASEAVATARALGFPVVLKTARPGLAHKTEHGGVALSLASDEDLSAAYRAMSKALGPRVLVAPMVEGEIEMILGVYRDDDFGPVIVMGFGGIYAEVVRDVVFAVPPLDRSTARRLLDRLHMRPLLDGRRGARPVDIDAYCDAAAKLSILAVSLRDVVREIDINPVILRPDGCTAVDVLVVPHTHGGQPGKA